MSYQLREAINTLPGYYLFKDIDSRYTMACDDTIKIFGYNNIDAFVGCNDESHISSVIEHAKEKKDWVHTWIQEYDGDDTHVRDWIREEISRSKVIEKLAKKFGYGYFDITKRPFEEHVQVVIDYLLQP